MFKSLVLLCSLFTLPAQAGVIVYQDDFESGVAGSAISGPATIVGTAGFSSFGFGNNFLQNTSGRFDVENPTPTATNIDLTNLPDHDSVNFGFLLALINSWDGNSNSISAPDFFEVYLDGDLIFSEAFTTGINVPQTAGIENQLFTSTQLGFGGDELWFEAAYDFTNFSTFTNIVHTSDSLTLSLITAGAGWQGGVAESYAVDNISISLNSVPEPSMFGIMGLGLIGLFRRRLFG